MKTTLFAAAALPLVLLSLPASACFRVFDTSNRLVYNAQTPPVNMAYQIHETLPSVYPGGHMVFDLGTDCPLANQETALPVQMAPRGNAASARRPMPAVATAVPSGGTSAR